MKLGWSNLANMTLITERWRLTSIGGIFIMSWPRGWDINMADEANKVLPENKKGLIFYWGHTLVITLIK